MERMHTLLKRQLKRYFGESLSLPSLPEEWREFIEAVNTAYQEFDTDRNMLERSLDLSSQELLQANSEMRAVLQLFPDIFFWLDRNGKIIDYKARDMDDFVVEPWKLVGTQIQDVPQKAIGDMFQHAIEQVREAKATVSIEYPLMMNDRKYFYEARLLPLLEDRIFVIIRNITERKRAEDALRESEEKYREVVERANDGIVILQETIIKYANPRSLEVLGYTPEEIVGTSMSNYIHPDELAKVTSNYERRVKGEHFLSVYDTALVHKDGTRVDVELNAGLIIYDGRPADLVIIRDIAERKRGEAEKQKIEQQVQVAGRLAAVGELAAGVAHELNNPIAAIQIYSELLDSRDDLDEVTKKDVGVIYKEALRAAKISQNLLSFARKHKAEKTMVSVNEALEKSLELHTYRMNVNNIEVETDLAPDIPYTMADFYQMQQVFVNIITNAEQAMYEANSRGKLSVTTRVVDKTIQIMFTDDGPGISVDNLERIFDPFFTTKDVGKGTGLGLSICYGIVREHHGHIHATSEPGKGTTIVIELPIFTKSRSFAEQQI